MAVGLTAIEEEFKLIQPTYQGYLKALTLRAKGYRDLIDLLLYVISQSSNIILLTRDYTLIKFLEENHEDTSKMLDEKKLWKSTPIPDKHRKQQSFKVQQSPHEQNHIIEGTSHTANRLPLYEHPNELVIELLAIGVGEPSCI